MQGPPIPAVAGGLHVFRPCAAPRTAFARPGPSAALLLLVLIAALPCLWAGPAAAQEISLSLGDGSSLSARAVQLLLLVTVLSLVPGLAITVTCFPFLVTTLSILRQGIGLQQSPPNMLIVSLALFLTYFVMEPVFREAWQNGVDPMVQGQLTLEQALPAILAPFRTFMAGRVDPATFETLGLLRHLPPDTPVAEAPLSLIVPSFLLSEIERAFRVGFLLFLPFLIIDLVVAAVLMSMGMMMVPPAVVSLPFKLAFFAVAHGWTLVAGALLRGYS